MPDLLIETDKFDGTADRALLDWLRECLTARGFRCEKIEERDGFWGCFIADQPVPVWMLVASVSDEGPTFEWGISVDAVAPLFNPTLWMKRDAGKRSAIDIMNALIAACEAEQGITVVEFYYGDRDKR